MKNWLQKVIRYGTYLTVFLTPLLYFGGRFYIPYSTSKTFFFYGIVELIIVAWLFLLVIDNKYRLSRRALLLFSPLFVFIIWLTISGIFGVNPEMSFWSSLGRGTGLITIYHCLGLSLVVASLIKSEGEKYLKKLLFWFLNGSFAIVLSVWFGNEGLNLPLEFLQKSKGGGLIGNSSLTASYLIFAVFLGLFFLFISGISRQQKVWFNVVLVTIISSPLFLNIYSLFVTHKFLISARGAMLGICVGILIIVLGRALLSKNSYIKYIGVAGVIICLGTFIWGWSSLMTPGSVVHKKFTEAATDSRFIFWNIARQGIADRPLIGWGPENYSVVYQKFFNPEIFKQSKTVAEVWNDKAHSIFYEIGVAGGYPAIILYLLFLCSLIYGAFQAYVLGNINRIQASILWGLLAGYVCQNLFVFDSLSSLLGLFVLVGIISVSYTHLTLPTNREV